MELRIWIARRHDARAFAQRVSRDPGPRRFRVGGARSRGGPARSTKRHAPASIHGMDLGNPDDARRWDLALHPYDQTMGALEPHPSSVPVHIGDSALRCDARAQT